MKLGKIRKKPIENLCVAIIEHLERHSATYDSNYLKETLDMVFPDKDERAYAYDYCYDYIKRKLDASNSD